MLLGLTQVQAGHRRRLTRLVFPERYLYMESGSRTGGVFKNLTSTRVHQIKVTLKKRILYLLQSLKKQSDFFSTELVVIIYSTQLIVIIYSTH